MKNSMKLVYQYMAFFFNISPTSNHLHPLQVENCDSNSRLVVDEDEKFRLERVNTLHCHNVDPTYFDIGPTLHQRIAWTPINSSNPRINISLSD